LHLLDHRRGSHREDNQTSNGKTLRVSEYDGRETVKPMGSYSMAPIIAA
jgi:hypothetical protein